VRYCILTTLIFSFCSLFGFGIENNVGDPSSELLEILAHAHITHDGTWDSIICETQKELRAPKQELWELEPENKMTHETAYRLFKKIGMIDSISPQKKHYRVALINGATIQVMRSRLWNVKEMWDSGVTFDQIVFLGGERPRDHLKEPVDSLVKCAPYPQCQDWEMPHLLPKTEKELAEFIYNQMDLPNGFRAIPVEFVNAKRPLHRHRPSHRDTICEWLKSFCPTKGETYLFVCDQPFVYAQQEIEKNTLPCDIEIETVGKGISKEYFFGYPAAPEVLLDTLYRWVYESKKCRNFCSTD
jgi:hypothetical protein